MINNTDTKPWHQQFWPWFLILFPLAMIIICVGLFYAALKQPISMVKKDYYEEGLTINKNITEIKHARELGLQAKINFQDNHHIQIVLSAVDSHFQLPPIISLQLDHPVDEKKDLSFDLNPDVNYIYSSKEITEADWQLLNQEKHWYVNLQSTRNGVIDWILQGEINQTNIHDLTLDAGRR